VEALRPGQRELIEAMLARLETLGVLHPGSGKSLGFQLSVLVIPRAAAVVSPLAALMQDQQEKRADAEIDAARLDSMPMTSEEREARRDLRDGRREFVYGTRGRLEDPEVSAFEPGARALDRQARAGPIFNATRPSP
jgi:ATP-dependent DNA helicase RecQ